MPHTQTKPPNDPRMWRRLIARTRTLAARWDPEWASALCKDALARLVRCYRNLSEEERTRLDLSEQDRHEARMQDAGERNDPVAFRAALREWEAVTVEAFGRLQRSEGAA